MRAFHLAKLVDGFVSPAFEANDDETIRRIKLVVVTSLMCIVISLFYSILHVVVSGSVLAAVTFFVGAIICFLLLFRLLLHVKRYQHKEPSSKYQLRNVFKVSHFP